MSRSQKLYNSITDIDEKFINEAQSTKTNSAPVNKYSWVKWGATAACLCLAVGAIAIPLNNEQPNNSGTEYYTAQDEITQNPTEISLFDKQKTPQASIIDNTAAAATSTKQQKKQTTYLAKSTVFGNVFPAAGAGGVMPGGAMCLMPIDSENNQPESGRLALTEKPLVNAKQVDATPMVYVNDKLYKNYAAMESVKDIEKDFVYLGDVESYTRNGASDPVPNKNFQANTPFVGAAINQYGDDVVIYMEVEDVYWLYKAVEEFDTDEREHPVITEEANPTKTENVIIRCGTPDPTETDDIMY